VFGVGKLPATVTSQAADVTHIQNDSSSISFDVARVGQPVVVRESDYPGWQVVGADAVFRVSPNYLVVVPTAGHVSLTKQRTPIDIVAITCGALGLLLLVGLVGRTRMRKRRRRDEASQVGEAASTSEATV
jgi:hypothetical protein